MTREVKNPKALKVALNKSMDDVLREQEQEKEFLKFLSSASDFLANEKYQEMKRAEEAYLKAKEVWENSEEYREFKVSEEAVIKEIRETSFNRPVFCDIGKINIKSGYERTTWDTKELTKAAEHIPTLLEFKKTTTVEKSVSIEYF